MTKKSFLALLISVTYNYSYSLTCSRTPCECVCVSSEAVRSQLPPGEEVVPFLLALLNVLSPHRFLGALSELLADVEPIHARWLQFLRQYLESIQPHLRRDQVRCPSLIDIDVRCATIGGMHIPQLERLAHLDKKRIV